eukprot:UN2579
MEIDLSQEAKQPIWKSIEEERQLVAEKLKELDELKDMLEKKKQAVMKAHVAADNLPKGCVLVWRKDLVTYESTKAVHLALDYHQMPDDTKTYKQCANCLVVYKSAQRDNVNFNGNRHSKTISWQIAEKTFPCPLCGGSATQYPTC